jgi:apolipoprotein N-acyltransferase
MASQMSSVAVDGSDDTEEGGRTDIPARPRMFHHAAIRVAASVMSGLLLVACFPKFDCYFLVWVACLPLVLAALHERKLWRAYLEGALAGAIFLAGSVYWFAAVMEHYGNLPESLAFAVLLLFLVVMSSFWGAFGLLVAWVASHSIRRALLLVPFLWTALELGRTYYYFSGFPWNLLGYAVEPVGLRQIASATGVYGLSFLAVATSALLAWAAVESRSRPRCVAGIVLGAWVGALVIGNQLLVPGRLPPAGNLAVLVQPDVPLNEQAEDWAPWRNPAPLERLIRLSLEAVGSAGGGRAIPLIVWPEDSAPFFFNRDPIFREAVEGMARQARSYAVVGATTFAGDDESKPQNAAVVLDPLGVPVLEYAKIHLVPFGEYVPGWLSGLAGKVTSQVGDFVPGRNYASAETPEGRIGVFICYEAIFPQLVRRLTPEGPSVLVNISDDAWYDDSSAADQHLAMVRVRAIENHRYILRATNDGITAIIDPYGRVIRTLPRHKQATLIGHFSYVSRRSFYTAHGDVFGWLCVVAATAILAARSAETFSNRGKT